MANKFHAKRIKIDNIWFASQREGAEYQSLKWRQKAKEIFGLEVHPKIRLTVEGQLVGTMIPDFAFFENGKNGSKRVYLEVKSQPTRTPLYRWKVRHLKAQYPHIDLREVF